jgi:sulfide:quinone oxidoreductase
MAERGRDPILRMRMQFVSSSHPRARVVIAGGGVAALEAALGLRALVPDRVHMTLVGPDPELTFRPSAAFEAFGHPVPPRYELASIARDLRADFVSARLEAVAPRARTIRLSSGARLKYDALVLAIGARATASIPGALTFRDQRDVPLLRRILGELESGAVSRLAFAVPSGSSWSMPLYELALLAAARAERAGADAEIMLVSPERRPLEVFGLDASDAVADVLAARGVRFVADSPAVSWGDGALAIEGDAPIAADRVLAAAQLRVHRMTGIPASWWGFVPTDTFGRVEGLSDVYAAGDMTAYPIKQGGLATQQADRVAHTIAADLGAPVKAPRSSHILRARLLGGERPLLLRTELDWQGRPIHGTVEFGGADDELDSDKVFGRYLTPYLQALGRGAGIAA